MKIVVIGAGYVGLVSAIGCADLGNPVVCLDVDHTKVDTINAGIPPIFEENLEKRLKGALAKGNLSAGSDYSEVKDADLILISVGTPSRADGSIDLSQVRSCAHEIAKQLVRSKKFAVIALRSTVLPGITESIVGKELEKAGRKRGVDFGLCMIPEFFSQGTALRDFCNPDRIVVGVSDAKTKKAIEKLYSGFRCPRILCDIKTAEMIKYASNSFLAAKLALTNDFAQMCETMGTDIDTVMEGVGLDRRIGNHFLIAGPGFGGSCLPKDVKAIASAADAEDAGSPILKAVLEANARHQLRLISILMEEMPLRNKTIAVLGLSFKENTDDIRGSPALEIIKNLIHHGASIRAFDPRAMGNMKKVFPDIYYSADWSDCLKGCDAALLISAWDDFKKTAAEYKQALGSAILIDSRRILKAKDVKKAGLNYRAIGRGIR